MQYTKQRVVPFALVLALVGCTSPGVRAQEKQGLESSSAPAQVPRFDRMTPEAWVVQQIGGAVVNIQAKVARQPSRRALFDDIFRQPTPHSQGSGVVIGPEGFIITNNHVIAGATEITVAFNEKYDSRQYQAEVIDDRPDEDLALLKISRDGANGGDFPYVKLGRSQDLMIGEKVIAIGNPYGNANTVSSGILSATGREITVADPLTGRPLKFEDLLQTDASINPGNSGGPLLNVHAELIGINNAIMPRAQGISFAIPSDKVAKILNSQFFNVNHSDRFDLGAMLVDEQGKLVARNIEETGSFAKAGIREGDSILSIAGAPARNLRGFSRALVAHRPGDEVSLVVARGGEKKELLLRLEPFDPDAFIWRRFGVDLERVRVRDSWGYIYTYLQVSRLRPDSIAAKLGVEKEDLVLRIGPTEDSIDKRLPPMTSLEVIAAYMRSKDAPKESGKKLWISILRPSEGQRLVGDFEI